MYFIWNQKFRRAAHIYENLHRSMKIERYSEYCYNFTRKSYEFFCVSCR